jgi:ABC-2 type transport system permease protein
MRGANPVTRLTALAGEGRFIAVWTVLLAVFALVSVMAFGPFHESSAARAFVAGIPRPVMSFLGMTRLNGWSQFEDAVLFGLIAPVAFMSLSIGVGSRHAARRDSVQGQPPSTRNTLLDLAPLAVGCLLLGVALFLAVFVAAMAIGEQLSALRLATAVAAQVALGIMFGTIALVAARRWRRAGLAALLATIVALGADALNGVGPAIPALRAVRYLSPTYYAEAGGPLSIGISPAHLVVLLAVAGAALAVAAIAVERPRGGPAGLPVLVTGRRPG